MARLRKTESVELANTLTSGYIIWFPDYNEFPADAGTYTAGFGNLFAYSSTDASVRPLNNVGASPFGGEDNWATNLSAKTTQGIPDPAARFISGNTIAQDARTLSACMSLVYTGRMMEASGEIAFIENFPLSACMANDPYIATSTAPSVDEMFNYSTKELRFGTDKHEVVFRPSDTSSVFKPPGAGPIIIEGTGGSVASRMTEQAQAEQPQAIGFAWRGLAPETDQTTPFSFAFTKNIEWRPKVFSGLTHTPPVQINKTQQASTAVHALDTKTPSWSTRVVDGLVSAAGHMAQGAFTGVGDVGELFGKISLQAAQLAFQNPGATAGALSLIL